MKKLFLCFLMLGILFQTNSIKVSAEETTNTKLELTMEQRSYLQDTYEIDPELKEEKGELVAITRETMIVTPDGKLHSEGTILPRNVLAGEVRLTMSSYKRTNGHFLITSIVEWVEPAFIRATDTIATAWGNKMALESTSLSRSYKYLDRQQVERVVYAYGPSSSGMQDNTGSWAKFDLRYNFVDSIGASYSGTLATASYKVVLIPNGNYTTNVTTEYAHTTVGVSASASFGNGGSTFKLSGAGTYSKMRKYISISY